MFLFWRCLLQAAWEQEWALTAEQRVECAVAIAEAKVAATKVGLEITNRIFEVMGAGATSSKYGFDRSPYMTQLITRCDTSATGH